LHIIILILAILTVLYFIYIKINQRSNEQEEPSFQSDFDYAGRIVFISRGKLFCRGKSGGIEEIHSQYVQEMTDRLERNKQRHGWKNGTSFGTSFTGKEQHVSDQINIQATAAQFIDHNKLIYFLVDNSFGGLFEYNLETKEEKRLIHKQNLRFEDLVVSNEGGNILCAIASTAGNSNVALMDEKGDELRELTGGDTLDGSPCWIPGKRGQILYQSQGLARDPAGYVVAYGPASIQLLDMDEGQVESILESNKYDFLSPKVSNSGDLFFIRRPYEPPKYSNSNFISDFVLFPFRLLRALFHYLNFFSLMYSRKPLTSASGPEVQADLKDILLKGKRIDTEKALRNEKRVNGVPSLVPKSWELVHRNSRGEEFVLATNVASFSLSSKDELLFTNGFGVFVLDKNQRTRIILKEKMIADVIVE